MPNNTSPVPTPTVPACSVPGAEHPVERAQADDLDGIADTLAAAFTDYAWTNWIVEAEGRQERLRHLHALTTSRVGLPHGDVWVTRCPGAAGEAEAATAHLRPGGPRVTLATIGVHPSHWRRGLATRLLRPALDVARELGAPAYLETSSTGNVALYERSGFRIIGEAVVPGGGPQVWAMQA